MDGVNSMMGAFMALMMGYWEVLLLLLLVVLVLAAVWLFQPNPAWRAYSARNGWWISSRDPPVRFGTRLVAHISKLNPPLRRIARGPGSGEVGAGKAARIHSEPEKQLSWGLLRRPLTAFGQRGAAHSGKLGFRLGVRRRLAYGHTP
jgi:hypothetical protein